MTVPTDPTNAGELHVPADVFRQFLSRIMTGLGAYAADADFVAGQMVEADLRGDSRRGSEQLPDFVEAVDSGDIDPRAQGLTLADTPALAVLDGCGALGGATVAKGFLLAQEKAKSLGVGTVLIKNGRPAGPLPLLALPVAQAGLVAGCTCNIGPATHAWPGTEKPTLANNSWGWSVPTGTDEPLLLELPSAPAVGSGDGWALMGAIITAALVGGKMPVRKNPNPYSQGVEYFLIVINPAMTGDPARFLKELRPSLEIIAPAMQAAWELRRQRLAEGIPVGAEHRKKLESLANRRKVAIPWETV